MSKTRSVIRISFFAFIITLMLTSLVYAGEVISSGECGAREGEVFWTLDDEGVLEISGNGYMKTYNYGDQPEAWNQSVQHIIVQQGVKSVSSYAFCQCNNLMHKGYIEFLITKCRTHGII